MTMVKIATVEIGSGGAASINFTSIPQGYTDLVIKASLRLNSGSPEATFIAFNSSTSSFTGRYLYGTNGGASAGSLGRYIGSSSGSYTANTFNSTCIEIANYAGSSYKNFFIDNVTENNGAVADANIIAGLWSNTAAITSISLTSSSGANWVQYSTATLYGITKGSGGATVS